MRPIPFKQLKGIKVFLITLSLFISFAITVLFLGFYIKSNRLLLQTLREQAASYFDLIVQTRIWNANYGGVFVEKKAGVLSNAYLREVGVEPDIKCEDGKSFTMRNPAMMTREISQLLEKKTGVKFHMTSLKPVNPKNAPDHFETKVFEQFSRGIKEFWEIDRTGKIPVFRYMAPLYVTQACLACHEKQGYKVGDVRGGINIGIPFDKLDREIKANNVIIVILAIITLFLVIAIIYFLVWKLAKQLTIVYEHLKEMAITDELTEINNRRYLLEQFEAEFQRARRSKNPLSLIMLDIDHFKRINDTFGHLFGDCVLKTIVARIKANTREYDLLGRIGGEEFLIISPYSTVEGTMKIAERIRNNVKGEKIVGMGKELTVTISAGVTMLKEQDVDVNALLMRVDEALYKAKQEGRDREVAL